MDSYVSATWAVPLSGLLDLDHPDAAHLPDEAAPIVLPVHVIEHPVHGLFVVDTGISRDQASGGPGPARGLVKSYLSSIEAGQSLGEIVEGYDAPLAGVLLTHAHLDHVLGLPDVPQGVPVYLGPGELEARSVMNALTRSTYNAALDGHTLLTLEFDGVDPIEGALDLLGDG